MARQKVGLFHSIISRHDTHRFKGELPLKKEGSADCEPIISAIHKSEERSPARGLRGHPRDLAHGFAGRQTINIYVCSQFEMSSANAHYPLSARGIAVATILGSR
jgi:hypothetical protein